MRYDGGMNSCPHCQRSAGQVKSGRNRSGSQRYLCKVCQRIYTPQPAPHGYDDAVRRRALKLYLDGNNFRRIARDLKVHHQSVVNWINAAHAQLPAPTTRPAPVETMELDELFTFVS